MADQSLYQIHFTMRGRAEKEITNLPKVKRREMKTPACPSLSRQYVSKGRQVEVV